MILANQKRKKLLDLVNTGKILEETVIEIIPENKTGLKINEDD